MSLLTILEKLGEMENPDTNFATLKVKKKKELLSMASLVQEKTLPGMPDVQPVENLGGGGSWLIYYLAFSLARYQASHLFFKILFPPKLRNFLYINVIKEHMLPSKASDQEAK